MTPADLAEYLRRIGAARVDGSWRCPCPVCPDPGPRDVALGPGRSRPLVAYCWRCCSPGDATANGRWWREFVRRTSPPEGMFAAWDAAELAALWSAADPAAGAGAAPAAAADPEVLHAVYTALLDTLELSDAHRRWLARRGFDPDWAFGAGYRTAPAPAHHYARAGRDGGGPEAAGDARGGAGGDARYDPTPLRGRFRDRLKSVPGFDRCGVLLNRHPAVLVPCRDCRGRVLAVKQRLLDGGKARMRLLSSRWVGGPQARNGYHCPLGVGCRRWPRVWVTEGERKADCHWHRRGLPTVAVPGVGAWRSALEALAAVAEPGAEVVVALDKDAAGRAAGPRLADAAAGAGYAVAVADWDDAKGLDDCVRKGRPVRLLPWRVRETQTPPPARQPVRGPQRPPRLRTDDEIIGWLRRSGPVPRDDVPTNQGAVGRLIREGRVRVSYTKAGQVVSAAD